MEYCKCGSIKEFGICSNKKCPNNPDAVSRLWIINGVELRYKKAITKEYAKNHTKEAVIRNVKKKQVERENKLDDEYLKPWTG